ncbi:hypothetical protein ACM46_13750 [Chryseobacterium angstadtii]|uniref:Tape measure domain-containing protein n=1 Tax=Chryseobacterium angstadtii TaxID=558151 RepID=A0A0J7IAS9_9FLAO|nr:tape measure protein [Chryseobacterium angstadtii]KMQ63009.1 hypothetical protein ACM46_13750 [Chryseobacterium angstadtii]
MSQNNTTQLANLINQINNLTAIQDLVSAFRTISQDIATANRTIRANIASAFTNLSNIPGNIYQNFKTSVTQSYDKLKNKIRESLNLPVSVRSYADIENDIRNVRRNLNSSRTLNGNNSIQSYRQQLSDLQGEAGRHPSQAGSGDSGSGGGKGGFSINGMLGAFGLAGVGAMIGGALKDGAIAAISGGIQKEQDVLSLSKVMGKGQDANAAYKNIQADAGNSPFQLQELLDANKALLSVGGDAQKAREEVMNLANAVTATGGGKDKLLELSKQMKEIKSSGKASGDQLKELKASGVDVYGMLAASTGKSAEQFKGGVDYATLSKSFEAAKGQGGMYEGALDKQNNTVTGKWENIKDRFSGTLTEIGYAFTPIISKVLDIGLKFSEGFAPALALIQPYIDIMANGLGQAVDFITGLGEGTNNWSAYVDILQGFLSGVWDTLGSVFDAVWSIVSGLVTWIANSELIKDVFAGIYGIIGIVLKVIGWVAEGLKWVWNNILGPILNGIESAYRWAKELITGEEVKVTKTTEIKANADLLKGMKDQDEAVKGFKASKGPAKADLTSGGRPTINRAEDTRRSNATKSQETGDTVSGGGQKTINITLGKFFETIQFNTMNSGETSEQLESVVMECLGRVLYNGAKVI